MLLTPLDKAILRTVYYFDLLEYPLTATEVWTWLYRPEPRPVPLGLDEIREALRESPGLSQYLERTEGFYHRIGRRDLVLMRKRRNNRVDDQMRKLVRVVKVLRLFPAIRMIAIASSLSIGNVREESDIDLFIIARRGQIWLARLCAAGLLKLLHQRPDTTRTRDRFCLAFFVTEEALSIEKAALGEDDIVFHYYVQSFAPIYDPDELFPKFFAENRWLQRHLPYMLENNRLVFEVGRPRWVAALHRVFDVLTTPLFVGPWRDWHRRLQMRILPHSLKSIANIDSRVIISDQMLKFHDKDNRREMHRKWLAAIEEL